MTIVTFDTNSLASGFLQGHEYSPPVQLLQAWAAGAFTLVVSEHLLSELDRTFRKPYFVWMLSDQRRADNLTLLRTRAVITPLTVAISGVATHPEDDMVLSTALSGNAQFLVTGDYKLVALRQYQGVSLVTAREFLAMLPGLLDSDMT